MFGVQPEAHQCFAKSARISRGKKHTERERERERVGEKKKLYREREWYGEMDRTPVYECTQKHNINKNNRNNNNKRKIFYHRQRNGSDGAKYFKKKTKIIISTSFFLSLLISRSHKHSYSFSIHFVFCPFLARSFIISH